MWDVFQHLAAAAARLRGPAGAGAGGAGAHHLCHPRLRAGDRCASCASAWPAAGARSRAASWPSSRRPAARLLPTSLYTRWTSRRCRALSRRAAATRAITSLQNERVKLIRSLEMRKARRETGLFVAEGASVLVDGARRGLGAADAGVPGRQRGNGHRAASCSTGREAAGAECLEVSQAVLAKLAAKDNPQTMLGVFEQRWAAEPDVASVAGDALWVALEGVATPATSAPSSAPPMPSAPAACAGRQLRRSLLARGRARQHGLDLQRAAGAHARRSASLALGQGLARRHRRHAPAARARISAPCAIARRRCW